MPRSEYPLPIEDTDNRRFLEAWREGQVVLQHCCECGLVVFYPRPICPGCWSDDLEWRKATGQGSVASYSLIYRPNHESFKDEIPIALAEIRLEEGASMLARIIGNVSALRIGSSVQVAVDTKAKELPLPAFRLSSG